MLIVNHAYILPWTYFSEEDSRFRLILKRTLMTFLALSVIIPLLPVPEITRDKQEAVPPRVAKLLLEKKQKLEPPKPKVIKPKSEPDQQSKTEQKPKKVEQVKPAEQKKASDKQDVRERVSKVGILALRDQLQELQQIPIADTLRNPNQRLVKGKSTREAQPLPSFVKDVTKRSGGIDTSKLGREVQETKLASRTTTQVESLIARGGDIQRDGDTQANVRTLEEIRLVLEKHKGSLNILYSRALRQSPGVRGKVLFELTIAPSGQVTNCKILESELKLPSLEQKLVIKLKSLDFGAKDVDATVIEYPLDFTPS